MDAAGNIYGTTTSTVYELSPNGKGGWTPAVIHTFTGPPGDGIYAEGTLVLDNAGSLYGTTITGGTRNRGTVYKLSPGGSGEWTEEILYSFTDALKDRDGAYPYAGIVFDAGGNIYGTTAGGGEGPKEQGRGTVFELVAPIGPGSYKEKILHHFFGGDGLWPVGASLILDSAGNLYGTTQEGGSTFYAVQDPGYGVVFEVSGVRATTATTLTSSPNPSTYGQAVIFTAVVVSNSGVPPDGETVSFMKGKTVLGTGSLSGGTATFTTSTLPTGTHSITAAYGGDTKFFGSTSNKVKQVVEKAVK